MSESVYPEWKAPAGDGEFLIWPEPGRIIAETRENHGRLVSETILIQNVPLCEVRRRQRQRKLPGIADDALIVASGHQTELYHAGVWAKDVLADLAARELGGTALHVAVDTDQPKHLSLRWPGNSLPITDDPNLATAEWAGMLESPTPEYLNKLRIAVASIDGFQPVVSKFFDSMVLRPPLSQVITIAMTRLDFSLGLNAIPAILSHHLDTAPYLLLTHHLLANADAFAHQYNAALAAYRAQHNVHSTMRPMPDLPLGADECETPFWLDHLTSGLRQRATVRRINNRWSLTAPSNDRFEFDASLDGWLAAEKLKTFLATHELRLSPRALTLTLYLRLLLVDQFIHGIGGGRYDQVTDALISSHFGITPPKFCVTTATLYHPSAAGRTRIDLPHLSHEGHQIRHRALGDEKRKLVDQINALPRRSPQRQTLFSQMRALLNKAAQTDAALKQWESNYQSALTQSRDDRQIFDRELFYALQPRERLMHLIQQYKSRFAVQQSNSI